MWPVPSGVTTRSPAGATQPTPSITDADHVSVGVAHACYITTAGGLACWGDNTASQASVPAGINAMSAVWWVSAGGGATCVISGSSAANMAPPGRLQCWGEATGDWNGTSAYEVACASWGCIVSEDAGGGAATTSFAATSLAGVPIPRIYNQSAVMGGTGYGYSDGTGTNVMFYGPQGAAIRNDGLAVADMGNQLIRLVNVSSGVVSTLAGQQGVQSSVDDANPLAATFANPQAVEYDSGGNLYVADTATFLLRKISAAGVVTTVAGQVGVSSPPKDGVGTNVVMGTVYDMRYDATSGVLYFTDGNNACLRVLYPNMTVGTIATPTPTASLALDAPRRMLFTGTASGIYKVTYDGDAWLFSGDASTTGYVDGPAMEARYAGLAAMERDTAGNLYASDVFNFAMRKVSPVGTAVTLDIGGQLSYPWGLRMDVAGRKMYIMEFSLARVLRVDIQYTIPPAPLAIGAAPLPPSPIGANVQLTAWRVLAANPTRAAVAATVDARLCTFATLLSAANTAGMNPAIRTLLLGTVILSEQPGAGPADAATFSTSARRGLHALTMTTQSLPPYALVLPALESLTVTGVNSAFVLAANSFAGADALTCINCGGTPGVANLTGLGVRCSEYAGDLSLLSASGLFNLTGIAVLDLTDNGLTEIQEHDFDDAPYLTHLYIGGNPGLTSIHCAAFTAAKQPLLSASNIDEAGNPLSTWRAGCPSPSPASTATASVTPSGNGTPSATPSGSVTPSNTATLLPVAAASSGAYKPDMFAAALALGLLSVAFIIALLFCRNALCCRCCCCAGRRAAQQADTSTPSPAKSGVRRIVITLSGTEDSAATAAAKTAVGASVTVNSTGGGFVLYGGDVHRCDAV